MRSGKTLGMTIYGTMLAEATQQSIVANYSISRVFTGNRLDIHRFSTWRDLLKFRNCIILFDEINTAMDSRNFKSDDQILFSHFFQQLGKLGITFMYTTQREHSVEKRIRDQTDYVVECRRLWPSEAIEYEWRDTQRNADEPLFIGRYQLEQPNVFYSLYDSFEVIQSTLKI